MLKILMKANMLMQGSGFLKFIYDIFIVCPLCVSSVKPAKNISYLRTSPCQK